MILSLLKSCTGINFRGSVSGSNEVADMCDLQDNNPLEVTYPRVTLTVMYEQTGTLMHLAALFLMTLNENSGDVHQQDNGYINYGVEFHSMQGNAVPQ